ncbi:MAG TPA: oligosaccharide flippase family protein [Rhodanobacteraceae bacterium]|nr:oligosaccharide flippase family protein [Rhodanobacteraceae bacterium]
MPADASGIAAGLGAAPGDRAGGDFTAATRLLRRGASGAFLVAVAGTGLGFAVNLVIARVIGREGYGLYALMFSWVSLLAAVAQAGQDVSVVRFMPTYLRDHAWGEMRGLRRAMGALVLVTSIAIAVAGCLVVHGVGKGHGAAWRATFYIGFALLPILTQLQQSGAMHRAFKRPVVTGLYQSIGRPLVLIALVGTLALTLRTVDAPMVAAACVAAALIALAGSAWHLSVKWPAAGRDARPAYETRRWAQVGSQMSLLAVIVVAGNKLDVLILGALMGTGDVGPYYAAVRMASFALFAQTAANVVLAPMIAERYDARETDALAVIAKRAARFSLAGALATGVAFTLAGRWVLGLFGPGFDAAYGPLLVLVWGFGASTALGEVGFLLSMTRYQKHASLFVLVGIAVNGAAAALLVPRIGALGAAIGAALSLLVWRGLAWWYVRRRLGIEPSVFGAGHAHGSLAP